MARTSKASTKRRKRARPGKLDLARFEKGTGVEMKGDRVVVRMSKDSHPELYDIDRCIRFIRKMIETYGATRRMADFVSFLDETERGLQIILRNHVEEAMRKYLGERPV